MSKKPRIAGTTGLKPSGALAVIPDGPRAIPAQRPTAQGPAARSSRKKYAGKKKTEKRNVGGGWLFGMVAGQVLFFALTVRALPFFAQFNLVLPPMAVLPVLFGTTLTGGVLGGFVQARLTAKTEAPPVRMRAYIFQALAETNRKLAEMFVDEEFNAAANNNTDRRKMKAKPELKVAPPTAAPRF